MPKLAKTIDIKRKGRKFTLSIDGEEFAYHLADEPVTTVIEANGIGTVNITLIAEHVTTDDAIDE